MARGTTAPAIVKLPEVVVNYSSLVMHELGNALDKGKDKGLGRTKARLD